MLRRLVSTLPKAFSLRPVATTDSFIKNLTFSQVRLQSEAVPASGPIAVDETRTHEDSSTPVNRDALYKMIELEIRGHDNAVLQSYQTFLLTAAKELNINVDKSWEPWRRIDKRVLLRDVFVHKKHRETYEWRTYFRIVQLKYMTGSTADTYLEYIERNLPEGCSMIVTKHALEELPSHIKRPEEVSK